MCTSDNLIKALSEESIDGVAVETVKNGVMCKGIRVVSEDNVSPVIYYSQDENVEAFVAKVKEVLATQSPKFDVNTILSRENILANAFVCVQKKSEEDIVKKEFLDDLEIYIRIAVDVDPNVDGKTNASIKASKQVIDFAKVSEDELFEVAVSNSKGKAKIVSMEEALGLPIGTMSDCSMYIGTYTDNYHGAGIIALPEVLSRFCGEHDVRCCYIIPSSIEEVILLPGCRYDPQALAEMTAEVNSSEVVPELRLVAASYFYDDETMQIQIAAKAI